MGRLTGGEHGRRLHRMITWSRNHAATSGGHGRRRRRCSRRHAAAVLRVVSPHRAVRPVRGDRGGSVLRRRTHRSSGAAPRRQVSVRPGTGEVTGGQHAAVGARRHRAARRVERTSGAGRRLVMMVVQVRVVHLFLVAPPQVRVVSPCSRLIRAPIIGRSGAPFLVGCRCGRPAKVAKYRASTLGRGATRPSDTGNSVCRPLIVSSGRAPRFRSPLAGSRDPARGTAPTNLC